MRILILALLTISIIQVAKGQSTDPIYFETDLSLKYSIGKETRSTFTYQPGVIVNIPKISRFRNPVTGLNFSMYYQIRNHISTGIGSGINVVKYEYHPVISGESIDKIFVPLFLSLRYESQTAHKWSFTTNAKVGYQFTYTGYGNSIEGVYFQEKGGMSYNVNVGIGHKIGRYTGFIHIGYEIDQFAHEDSLDFFDLPELSYSDKIFYKTTYHLVNFGIGVIF